MSKKMLIALSLAIFSGMTVQAIANTTIYTDEIGRLHFLGKDPGSRVMQQEIQNFNNPEQKDLTNIIYKNDQENSETKVNTISAPESDSAVENSAPTVPVKGRENKTKGSFTFNKGAMDASDPYTFGETNLTPASENKIEKPKGKIFKTLDRDY